MKTIKCHLRFFFAVGVTLFVSSVAAQEFPPTVRVINPQVVREGATVKFMAQINDPDSNTFTYHKVVRGT